MEQTYFLLLLGVISHEFVWWLQPLGMKKIEAEKALQEAAKGCNLKKGGQCQIVQVHVRLLSVILYASDEP